MPSHYYTQQKEKLKLSEKAFASGGEGSLYKIISPNAYTNSVAKIYHPSKRTAIRQEKINYLLQYPPIQSQTGTTTWHPVLVWPQDILYTQKGEFVGLIMPLVQGHKLEVLCSNKLPKALQNSTWNRFGFDNKEALDSRLKLCYNIAAAIHDVHSTGQYILIDLKPDNVMIRPDGIVSLVDMDSVEVVKDGQTLYEAPVATPEYTPPENYLKDLDYDPTQEEAWDRFSMAVIFYKLLLGIHPFAASCRPPFDTATSLHQKIEQGLFVHNSNKKDLFLTIPQPHQKFLDLAEGVQELFLRCFVAGHQNPNLRPSAEEWCYVLSTGQILGNDFPPPSSKFLVPNEVPSLLPNNQSIAVEQLFEPPTFELVSVDAEIQLKVSPKKIGEFKASEEAKKELKTTRFANLLFLIFLITAVTALSIVSPLIIAALVGLIIYLGLNFRSYQNRNLGGRRQLLNSTLQAQRDRFNMVIEEVKTRELRADKLLHYIQKAQKRFSKEELAKAQQYQEQASQQTENFKAYIAQQNNLTKVLEKKESTALKQLHQEFHAKLRETPALQNISGINIEQKLQQVQTLKQTSNTIDDRMHYTTLEEQLTTWYQEFTTRKDMIRQQYYQEYQKIVDDSKKEYQKLQDSLGLYQNAVPDKKKRDIQNFFQQQGPRLRQLEGLKYQIKQLEPSVESSIKDYHRIKIEMDRYGDFSFGSHLLQMLFLKK